MFCIITSGLLGLSQAEESEVPRHALMCCLGGTLSGLLLGCSAVLLLVSDSGVQVLLLFSIPTSWKHRYTPRHLALESPSPVVEVVCS